MSGLPAASLTTAARNAPIPQSRNRHANVFQCCISNTVTLFGFAFFLREPTDGLLLIGPPIFPISRFSFVRSTPCFSNFARLSGRMLISLFSKPCQIVTPNRRNKHHQGERQYERPANGKKVLRQISWRDAFRWIPDSILAQSIAHYPTKRFVGIWKYRAVLGFLHVVLDTLLLRRRELNPLGGREPPSPCQGGNGNSGHDRERQGELPSLHGASYRPKAPHPTPTDSSKIQYPIRTLRREHYFPQSAPRLALQAAKGSGPSWHSATHHSLCQQTAVWS
jgi:hypothetical protein